VAAVLQSGTGSGSEPDRRPLSLELLKQRRELRVERHGPSS
jgi:hypothetical protein